MKTYKLDMYRSRGLRRSSYHKFFVYLFRCSQEIKFKPVAIIYKLMLRIFSYSRGIEIPSSTKIGPGFCLWHPWNITIPCDSVLGKNVTVCKNAFIGRELRGKRHGAPKIGNEVWIGANSSIVGNINIGDDVLIAPGSYVNCDIPSHSVVLGNPCIIKHKDEATSNYIQNRIEWMPIKRSTKKTH